jgi:pimeloyl-ACP methyl ester carboxylesterase
MGNSFSLDGQRLAYTVYGSGPRLTVLLHGLLFSQYMHETLARSLADRGHRVVTLDLLGHGESDRPTEKWRYSMPACHGSRALGTSEAARASARATGAPSVSPSISGVNATAQRISSF